jgi:hypothetical protein
MVDSIRYRMVNAGVKHPPDRRTPPRTIGLGPRHCSVRIELFVADRDAPAGLDDAARGPPAAGLLDRISQLAHFAPRAVVVPLVVTGVALAVLVLLGPTIFLPGREPFYRLMEFLELVLGRPRSARQEPRLAG